MINVGLCGDKNKCVFLVIGQGKFEGCGNNPQRSAERRTSESDTVLRDQWLPADLLQMRVL